MRRASIDSGFFICWILNMLFNWELGALAFILWIASEWFKLSWYPAAAAAGLWVIGTLIFTIFLCWLGSGSKNIRQSNDLPNLNPYSKTTADILKDTPAAKDSKD